MRQLRKHGGHYIVFVDGKATGRLWKSNAMWRCGSLTNAHDWQAGNSKKDAVRVWLEVLADREKRNRA